MIRTDELAKSNEVRVSGFGEWAVREKRARHGRSPKTGEGMMIDARKVDTFRRLRGLREQMKEHFGEVESYVWSLRTYQLLAGYQTGIRHTRCVL